MSVFISYSRVDQDFVLGLASDLRNHNIPVWVDQLSIKTGHHWDSAIEEAIESATFFLIVISQTSRSSQNVLNELDVALELKKRVIPIVIDDSSLPLRVRRMQYLDFRDNYDDGLSRLLNLLQPDTQKIKVSETKNADNNLYRDFWHGLIEKSTERNHLIANRTPGKQLWYSMGAGISGLSFSFLIFADAAGLELYIDTIDKDKNKAYFDMLFEDRLEIEEEYGDKLDWQRIDDKRASRIRITYYGYGSLHEPESWDNLQEFLLEKMNLFVNVFKWRINNLR